MRIQFTDPTKSFQHDDETLKEGILNLIRKARNNISIHGYYLSGFYEQEMFDIVLVEAIKRGVKLTVFGGKENHVTKIYNVFSMHNPICYFWNNISKNERAEYHLKAIIVDDLYIYLGSANLTRNGLENSAEVGLIFENDYVCRQIERYAEHLVDEGFFVRL